METVHDRKAFFQELINKEEEEKRRMEEEQRSIGELIKNLTKQIQELEAQSKEAKVGITPETFVQLEKLRVEKDVLIQNLKEVSANVKKLRSRIVDLESDLENEALMGQQVDDADIRMGQLTNLQKELKEQQDKEKDVRVGIDSIQNKERKVYESDGNVGTKIKFFSEQIETLQKKKKEAEDNLKAKTEELRKRMAESKKKCEEETKPKESPANSMVRKRFEDELHKRKEEEMKKKDEELKKRNKKLKRNRKNRKVKKRK